MAGRPLPDRELLLKLLRYDQETGELTWLPRPKESFRGGRDFRRWNVRYANKPAFTAVQSDGYKNGRLAGRTYKAHRIIWLMIFGEWPNKIDHINGDTADNRLCNLRAVDHAENMKNRKRPRNNRSGCTGVTWHKKQGQWCAMITLDGKRRHLGSFDDFESAVRRRKVEERRLGFHPNHDRRRRQAAAKPGA